MISLRPRRCPRLCGTGSWSIKTNLYGPESEYHAHLPLPIGLISIISPPQKAKFRSLFYFCDTRLIHERNKLNKLPFSGRVKMKVRSFGYSVQLSDAFMKQPMFQPICLK